VTLQNVAFDFSKGYLLEGGNFLCKLWFGDGIKTFMKHLEQFFKLVKLVKPHASRSDSAEIFIFCKGFTYNNTNNNKNSNKNSII